MFEPNRPDRTAPEKMLLLEWFEESSHHRDANVNCRVDLAVFEILTNAHAEVACDAVPASTIAEVEEAYGTEGVSDAFAEPHKGVTVENASAFLFAVLRENSRKTKLFGLAMATVLELRKDVLRDPKAAAAHAGVTRRASDALRATPAARH